MAGNAGGQDPESEYGQDQVKVFSHEGDGENTEHLNSMDLHDVKTELEKDAEQAETSQAASTTTAAVAGFSVGMTTSSVTSSTVQPANIKSIMPPQMVYANGGAVPFMMPPFAAGTPIYAGLRPVKMEGAEWAKVSQVSIPAAAYGYPAGFVSGLSMEQTGIRPTYPFMIPGQYVTQMPYQQLTALGNPIAPNAAVHPNSGLITPVKAEKKPHIKKPLNAFMLFMKEKRADVIKECTLKESAAINQILGKMWHALDRTEQAKYYEMAREERARHLQMYPGWSARDNYAVHKKRRKRKAKPKEEEVEDEEEEPQGCDPNAKKCRARYGLEQSEKWCGPCRRKKKCVRVNEDEDDRAGRANDNVMKEDTTKTRGRSQVEESRGENPVVPPVPVTLPTVAT